MENNDHLKKVVNVVKRKEDLYILATERNAKLFSICYNHLIELNLNANDCMIWQISGMNQG